LIHSVNKIVTQN